MQLDVIYDVLQTVQNAGINAVVLKKIDGGMKIMGVDTEETLLVYSELGGDIIPESFGVHRVQTLLSRMKLFDFSKATASVSVKSVPHTDNEGEESFIKDVVIKIGKRKVSFTGARPSTIKAPSGLSETEIVNKITLTTNEGVPLVIDAMNALGSPNLVKISGSEKDILLEIDDGIADDFVDVIGTNSGGEWSYLYRRDSLQRLIKQAAKFGENVDLGITKRGLMYVIVNDITFVLIPQVE